MTNVNEIGKCLRSVDCRPNLLKVSTEAEYKRLLAVHVILSVWCVDRNCDRPDNVRLLAYLNVISPVSGRVGSGKVDERTTLVSVSICYRLKTLLIL